MGIFSLLLASPQTTAAAAAPNTGDGFYTETFPPPLDNCDGITIFNLSDVSLPKPGASNFGREKHSRNALKTVTKLH